MARRSARALFELNERKLVTRAILTDASIQNAMVLHAAFGGSTNLLLHIPAMAQAAKLEKRALIIGLTQRRQHPGCSPGSPLPCRASIQEDYRFHAREFASNRQTDDSAANNNHVMHSKAKPQLYLC